MTSRNRTQGPRRRLLIRLGLVSIIVGISAALPAAALATPPPNDDFANAEDLGVGSSASVSGTNRFATAEFAEPDHHGFLALTSAWYRWTAPANGVVRLDTCGSDFDTVLAVYRGPAVDALGRVASSDDSCGFQSRLRFGTTSGTTYRIAIDGKFGDQGSINLEMRPATPPPNDDFANAFDLGTGATASASGTNLDATAEPGEPAHWLAPEASVWYRWTAAADRKIQIETCGSDFDTVLAVYMGPVLGALSSVASNDDSCELQSRVQFDAAAGESYRIAVDGFGEVEGSIEFALRPSNQFRFGKPERDRKLGTAELIINVPNPGVVQLARTPQVRGAVTSTEAAGEVRLTVNARGDARRVLMKRGRVKVRASVIYSPEGGDPRTKSKSVTLIKRA